jgi:hypothetical protein
MRTQEDLRPASGHYVKSRTNEHRTKVFVNVSPFLIEPLRSLSQPNRGNLVQVHDLVEENAYKNHPILTLHPYKPLNHLFFVIFIGMFLSKSTEINLKVSK